MRPETALLVLQTGLADPLTIVAGLVAGTLSRSWSRTFFAGLAAAVLLLGVEVATGRVHPQHIAWLLLPAKFMPAMLWAAIGHVGWRWHDAGERAGLRLARGLALGVVGGAIVGFASGLGYVNCPVTGAVGREASWMTMVAALLGGAIGAIIGMIRAISRPSPSHS